MTTNSLLVASDAMVSQGAPTKNYGSLARLELSGGATARYGHLYFNQPFPLGVTVISATLHLYQRGAATGGSRTLQVRRLLTSWVESKVTFDTRPTTTTAGASSVTLGNSAVDGREWAFDVAAIMQAISDGAPWYGLRVESDLSTIFGIYGRESAGEYVATLEVEWSDAPAAPSQLAPSAGRAVSVARPTLRFDFGDPTDETLQAIHVQVSTSTSFASPAFDSGEAAADLPQWTLDGDLTAATTYYWRAMVQDTAGLWSDWSDTATFARTAKPTVAITNPAESPDNIVYESTPEFAWTVTGGTQQAYQLFIVDPDDTSEVLWTSTKITAADTSSTLPDDQRLLLSPGGSYQLVLRVWDTVARESIPEETPYVEVSRDFTFGTTGTVDGVTGLTVSTVEDSPFATLQFDRDDDPDAFVIIRDGAIVASIDPADALVSGTTYQYVDRSASPRTDHMWGVAARVGTQTSTPATVTGMVEPLGVWLYELDGDAAICIAGAPDPDGMISTNASEDTAIHKPVGSANPVLITQAIRGPEGDVAGTIDISDLDAWTTLTAKRAVTLGMTRVDLAQKVQIYNTVRDHADEFGHGDVPIKFSYVVIR